MNLRHFYCALVRTRKTESHLKTIPALTEQYCLPGRSRSQVAFLHSDDCKSMRGGLQLTTARIDRTGTVGSV